ncbi:cysteine-rich repeat secretory protein 12 [Canna indica]|uniref:Cysteine-rich repeat secretory protein 12 n=1 Tax=Canna indica TaxID=4628 RepID=A0AAQ3L7E1_9LILI|nr:cysteine-rich repeat secretory protein 12 [Canna indica]
MSKVLLLLLFSFAAFLTTTASASDDYNVFVYAGCSQPKYTVGSPYQVNVESLLASLINAASFSSYANFTSAPASGASPAYGLLQCRGDLSVSDCQSCVRSGLSQLSSLCPSAAGAAIQLRGCFVRYGNDSFLGKPDTGVLYKKCGPAAGGGYNSDLLSMRDAALADLTTSGAGAYRVGAAGYVQAVAQCVGDQSAKECDDCVAAAVAQLRALCGYAVAGDAYLGKCYGRYWSNGIYTPKTEDHGDETGKTLAIIIGLMAGVGLIIVFLSFLRKAGSHGIWTVVIQGMVFLSLGLELLLGGALASSSWAFLNLQVVLYLCIIEPSIVATTVGTYTLDANSGERRWCVDVVAMFGAESLGPNQMNSSQ